MQQKTKAEQDTRVRVLRTASELFAARGYAATSISAIREASGVLPSSIYWEFGNKEGIFAAVLEDSAARWLAQSTRGIMRAMRARTGSNLDRLAAYFDYMANAMAERPEFVRLTLLIAVERREGDEACLEIVRSVRQRAVEALTRLFVATGLVEPNGDEAAARDVARLAIACFDGAFAAAQIDADAVDLRRVISLLYASLSDHLSAPP